VRLVDADHRMLAVARELAEAAPVPAGATIETISGDLARLPALPAADVVVLSYTLGEVAAPDRARVVEAAWAATRDTLIVIDPGTSPGFERVRLARARLVEMGARVAAPCPHGAPCPMTAPDWCHVAARTDRTRLHRRLKGGSLGYEDEKFSYVAVTRRDPGAPAARIVARPQPRTGLVTLRLCTRDGLRIETVSRRHGPRYRAARHAAWGDEWDR
jgi:ribosomal protein RSM22 (predicted rRNA methylase)